MPNGEIGRVVMSKTEMSSPVYTGCLTGLLIYDFFSLMSVLHETVEKFEPFSEKSHPITQISSYLPDRHIFTIMCNNVFRANLFKTLEKKIFLK